MSAVPAEGSCDLGDVFAVSGAGLGLAECQALLCVDESHSEGDLFDAGDAHALAVLQYPHVLARFDE